MVSRCFVPGCSTRGTGIKYFCVPFTNKARWQMWVRLCPFLLKYPATKLESIRLCRKHFLPEHITDNLKLKPCAIPLINLDTSDTPSTPDYKLEITPSSSDAEPFIIKVRNLETSVKQRHPDYKLEITPTSNAIEPYIIKVGNVETSDKESNFKLEITPCGSITEPFIFNVVNPSGVQPTIEQNCSSMQTDLGSEMSCPNSSTPPPLSPDIPQDMEHLLSITPSTSTATTLCRERKLKPRLLVKRGLITPDATPRKRMIRSITNLKNKLRCLRLRYKKLKTRFRRLRSKNKDV